MSKLTKTPLHNLHRSLEAKIIPFAGYEMPLQYPLGTIKEHLHCRNLAGFFDISHMGQCVVSGSSAAQELEKLVVSDIQGLTTGQQRYTLLTNENGGIIDDIIITCLPSGYRLIVNAACKEKNFKHLQQHLSKDCNFSILNDQALFALQGPSAAEIMQQLSKPASELTFMQACTDYINEKECFISRCGYTGEDGFEISIAEQHAETLAEQLLEFKQVAPIGLGARDTLRLEAGLSLYGHEINETISPIEAGLKWTLRKQNTNFLGSEVIYQQINAGATLKRVGLLIDGKIPLRQDCGLFDMYQNKIGSVTSGSYSPCLENPIALALISSDYHETEVYANIRNRQIIASITSLPFIAHRYRRT